MAAIDVLKEILGIYAIVSMITIFLHTHVKYKILVFYFIITSGTSNEYLTQW